MLEKLLKNAIAAALSDEALDRARDAIVERIKTQKVVENFVDELIAVGKTAIKELTKSE